MGEQEKECEGVFVFKGTVSQDLVWLEELSLLLSVATMLRGQGPLLKAENQLEKKNSREGKAACYLPLKGTDWPD